MSSRFNDRACRPLSILSIVLSLTSSALAQTLTPLESSGGLQMAMVERTPESIEALFVSDIHFDPFADPAKGLQLVRQDVGKWRAILSESPSPDRDQRFQSLQRTCDVRGIDTPFALFDSSLKAMQTRAANAKFILVAGDLVAHGLDCKFKTSFPTLSGREYESFVTKTLAFVIHELRESFPGTPVYAALGNNDSNCGDYHLDRNTEFLSAVGRTVVDDLPFSERQAALVTFGKGGYYRATLPGPLKATRLIVLDDILMSSRYSSCRGKSQEEPEKDQIAWLKDELLAAQHNHYKVWLLSHIPPGVDMYATFTSRRKLCYGDHPIMFLKSSNLIDNLRGFGDVVQLGLFAHTHMDEFRLLNWSMQPGMHVSGEIAVKLLPSISPFNGNNPAFTIASIDSDSATLLDYRVFAATNKTGIGTHWNPEYDYSVAFNENSFSPSTLEKLLTKFKTDPDLHGDSSLAYVRDYSVGDNSSVLREFWRQYVCGLSRFSEDSYISCACAVKP